VAIRRGHPGRRFSGGTSVPSSTNDNPPQAKGSSYDSCQELEREKRSSLTLSGQATIIRFGECQDFTDGLRSLLKGWPPAGRREKESHFQLSLTVVPHGADGQQRGTRLLTEGKVGQGGEPSFVCAETGFCERPDHLHEGYSG